MTPLNLDAGEGPDETPELWSLFDVLAIACGGHAGDAASMERVVESCARHGIVVGAHPSYPDREGFGRRSIAIEPAALAAEIAAQCRTLDTIATRHARCVVWVKPHGALYHDAAAREEIADAVVRGAVEGTAPTSVGIIGPPHGALHAAARARGVPYLREGFADRRLRADGSIVPRSEPGAVIVDPQAAAAQAVALARSVDTICLHADTPGVIAIARAVRQALRAAETAHA